MKQRNSVESLDLKREERVRTPELIHPEEDGALTIEVLEERLTPEEWPPTPFPFPSRQVGWGC